MPQNLLNIHRISAELLLNGVGRSFGSIDVRFRASTERGYGEVDQALADVAAGRAKVYINIAMYRIHPEVMIDDRFNPLPGIIDQGLKWIQVADYVICNLYFSEGQAPKDENEYTTVTPGLLRALIAESFPGENLQIIFKDRGHYHPDIYVSRRDDL